MNHTHWAISLALLVTACGGGDNDATDADGGRLADAQIVWPLYADDGSLMPPAPQAVPAEPAARTRSGLYALRAQAELLDQALPGRTVWVEVECCDALTVDFAVATAQVLLISLGLDRDAPVFVTGSEPRLSAAAVEQLADTGMRRVFLVVD